jgi:hypothetical protein
VPAGYVDLDVDIRRLFRHPSRAFAVLGRGADAAPQADQTKPLSASIPVMSRLQLLDAEFRGQLRLLADQVEEFDDAETRTQLEWEAIALLIAIRELRRHIPELVAPPGSD